MSRAFYQFLTELPRTGRSKEKPYPKNGGVVPDSPRAAIAEARAAIQAPTYENLKTYLTDSRSDIRIGVSLLSKALVTCLSGQPKLALTFPANIEEGAVSADIVDKALASGVDWRTEPIAKVSGLLNPSTKALRFAAMVVLRQDYCLPESTRSEATRMTKDPDRKIEERAYAFSICCKSETDVAFVPLGSFLSARTLSWISNVLVL